MRRWRALIALPLILGTSGCLTGMGVMPRARTAEYNYGGSGLFDSFRDYSLRGSYGYFFTPNWQLGGSVSYNRTQFNSNDDAFNRYRIAAELNYLWPLATSPTALYFGALGAYRDATEQDGIFTYGGQFGAKFFVRPDWNLDAGFKAKWSDEELADDPTLLVALAFNPLIGAGIRQQMLSSSEALFARNVWLLDGRASWEFQPENVMAVRALVGYFFTQALLFSGALDWERIDPDNGDSFTTTGFAGALDYHFLDNRLWRPYVGARVGYLDATDQDGLFSYGAQVGIRWWMTQNVTPFAEFGVQNFDDDNISAQWTVRVGISQAIRGTY